MNLPCTPFLIMTTLLLAFTSPAEERKATSKISTERKIIALTFDDGPNQFTESILERLEKHQVKATFFQIGKNMKAHPKLSQQVIRKGHEIGNHSMTHPRLPELATQEAIAEEITGFQKLAKSTVGKEPQVFRAPFLKFDARVWSVLDEQKLPAFNASVYADYKGDGELNDPAIASAHAATVIAKVKSGTIILMHEREITLHYLDEVVAELKASGYTFLTVSELIAGSN